MKTKKTIFEKIITGIAILLSGFYSFFGLAEFYKIGIKKETEFYPFGGEGPVPYYYRTAELYSHVNLTYGIAFGILLGIGFWSLRKNKINGFIIFGLTILLIIVHIYHGWAE